MVNWSSLLDGNPTATRLVEEFVLGRINRDNMIVKVPQLREVIRNKGVTKVRNLAKRSLKRRNIYV